MKKLLITTTLLLAFLINPTNANNIENISMLNPIKPITSVNAFCKLIQMGDFDTVKYLIEDGEDLNKKSTGLTPLMFAARHNRIEITKLLIKNGAKLKLKSDRKGFTALKWAEISKAKDTYKIIKEALENKKRNKKRNKKSR